MVTREYTCEPGERAARTRYSEAWKVFALEVCFALRVVSSRRCKERAVRTQERVLRLREWMDLLDVGLLTAGVEQKLWTRS